MLKISEVYEKQFRAVDERPDGSEYVTYATRYDSRTSLVNKDYIVAVYPHEFTSDIIEKKVFESFPEGTKFTTLILDGNSFRKSEIVVVGSFEKFCKLLEE